MPRDLDTLEKLGLRDIPRWFREKYRVQSLLPASQQHNSRQSPYRWKSPDGPNLNRPAKAIQWPPFTGTDAAPMTTLAHAPHNFPELTTSPGFGETEKTATYTQSLRPNNTLDFAEYQRFLPQTNVLGSGRLTGQYPYGSLNFSDVCPQIPALAQPQNNDLGGKFEQLTIDTVPGNFDMDPLGSNATIRTSQNPSKALYPDPMGNPSSLLRQQQQQQAAFLRNYGIRGDPRANGGSTFGSGHGSLATFSNPTLAPNGTQIATFVGGGPGGGGGNIDTGTGTIPGNNNGGQFQAESIKGMSTPTNSRTPSPQGVTYAKDGNGNGNTRYKMPNFHK